MCHFLCLEHIAHDNLHRSKEQGISHSCNKLSHSLRNIPAAKPTTSCSDAATFRDRKQGRQEVPEKITTGTQDALK